MSKTIETAVDLKKFQAELENFKKESGRGLLKNLENTHCVVVRDDGTPIRDKSLINDYLKAARDGTCTAYLSPGPGMPLAKFSKTFQGYIKPEELAADTLKEQKTHAKAARLEGLHRNIPPKPSGATRFFSGLLRVITLGIFGGFQSVKNYNAATAAYNAAKLEDENVLPEELENRQRIVKGAMNTVNSQHAENVLEFGSYKGPVPEELQVEQQTKLQTEQQVKEEKIVLPVSKAKQAINHSAALLELNEHFKESLPNNSTAEEIYKLYENKLQEAKDNKDLLPEKDVNALYIMRDMNPMALQALCAKADVLRLDNENEDLTMDTIHNAVNETYSIYKNAQNYEKYMANKKSKEIKEAGVEQLNKSSFQLTQ